MWYWDYWDFWFRNLFCDFEYVIYRGLRDLVFLIIELRIIVRNKLNYIRVL